MKINYILVYSSIGHALMHMFSAFYFVIILEIEKVWSVPYESLLKLWFLGSLLVGAAAIPAGWLSDKWSRSGMIFLMFIGMGLASLFCGISKNEQMLFFSLTFLGLFCAIYHPVAIAWLVNNSKKRGITLGINGVFGTLGVGLGGIAAGSLIKISDWRTAFIVPAIFSILMGFCLLFHLISKKISYHNVFIQKKKEKTKRTQAIMIALIFLVSIFCLGLVFQITQTASPKLLELRLQIPTITVGLLVALIYGFSGAASLVGGWAADRYNLKKIYITGILLQAPCLIFIAQIFNPSVILLLFLAVSFNTSILPAENILLANFSPQKYHGLVYGLKFILAFGSAPVAVLLASKIFEIYQDFYYLFLLSSSFIIFVFLIAAFLPNQRLTISN